MAIEEYPPTLWVNDSIPAINSTNLNKIETGIKEVTDAVIALEGTPLPDEGIDIGTVSIYAGQVEPTGSVFCRGQLLNRVTYDSLFVVIGTIYGAGDGTTTFNVPDFRGMFVRGYNNGTGLDSGRSLGDIQQEEVGPHNHELGRTGSWSLRQIAVLGGNACYTNRGDRPLEGYPPPTDSNDGEETRPINIAMNYIIRAR